MDVRNNMEGLRNLLGAPAATPARAQGSRDAAATAPASSADSATVSSAGASVSEAVQSTEARMDKVAAVQAALKAGTYNVPASAVASKVVDSMLGGSSR